MTGPNKEPDTPTAIMQLRDLRKLITDQVSAAMQAVTGAGNNEPQQQQQQSAPARGGAAPRRNVQDEVSAALAKIDADRAREERETRWQQDIDELKEKTKEKPPVERGRMHRFMGWGD